MSIPSHFPFPPLSANARRGNVKKVNLSPSVLRMGEEDPKRIPSKGWAEMTWKVY